MSHSGKPIIIGVFVDDMLRAHHQSDDDEVRSDEKILGSKFKLKNLGATKLILGMVVERNQQAGTIKLHQRPYIESMIQQFSMSEERTQPTPMTPDAQRGLIESQVQLKNEATMAKIAAKASGEELSLQRKHTLALKADDSGRITVCAATMPAVIGSLNFAATSTRPDIAMAVNVIARSNSSPTEGSVAAAKYLLQYLKGTAALGLTFSAQGAQVLEAYSDSDWGGDNSDAKSTTGTLLTFAGSAIFWRSQKQATVALSSTEAEYVACSEACRDVVAARAALAQMGCAQPDPTPLFIDNRTTISMVLDDSTMARRKHINVRHHYVRQEALEHRTVTPVWVSTEKQLADIFTKALPRQQFTLLREQVMGTQLISS